MKKIMIVGEKFNPKEKSFASGKLGIFAFSLLLIDSILTLINLNF